MQAFLDLLAGRRIRAIGLAAILLCLVIRVWSIEVDAPLLSQYIQANYHQQGIKNVRDIVQDRDGFIWVGTYDGLYRYDGVRFENFSLKTRTDFPTNNIKPTFPIWNRKILNEAWYNSLSRKG
jgi:ligand-binding sensor domain-containing protein